MNNPERPGGQIELIAFDVDGTLVEHPEQLVIWQLLNLRFTGDMQAPDNRFDDYLSGRMDYPTWVELDVSDWIRAGATREMIMEEVRKLRPTQGAREVLDRLKARGYRLAVISGTLDVVLDEFFPTHPFDTVFTNHLRFDPDDVLCGWKATEYDMDGKTVALRRLAEQAGLSLSRCGFVGDHVNDVSVAREAGFSVAFNPKSPELETVADVVVRSRGLDGILRHFPGPEGKGTGR